MNFVKIVVVKSVLIGVNEIYFSPTGTVKPYDILKVQNILVHLLYYFREYTIFCLVVMDMRCAYCEVRT
jgi:hypothetical protein